MQQLYVGVGMFGTVEECVARLSALAPGERVMVTVWTVEDVWEERPDLTAEQAEDVLRVVNRRYGTGDWSTLAEIATDLFGPQVVE
ncbi:hypothetical protein M9M43_002115 [Escherichia coli]|uniref:hypothetical protein n=1 Tax=Escherichia coli TaxID=562 RepID=UPI002AC59523|nr:hypothetical protein [Escherichia coli]EIO6575326.1 hypothetical protein [Escherichia coli]EJF8096075.1 hypothetical protein [Escherichia coli]MDZ4903339.1 hypothetical protein [Escherichia coli]HCB8192073.1 hypothetical protein [Escherichia coli]